MIYSSRTEAIKDYLKENEILIEKMRKGKIEINLAGRNIVIKTTEVNEKIKVERPLLTLEVDL